MNRQTLLSLTLALAVMMAPSFAMANKPQTMLLPTRVVIDNNERFASVHLKNSGDAPGNYTVDLVDMRMDEGGAISEFPEGEKDEFSAIPLIRLSPRSITLQAGETQTIRLVVRKPEGLADGEYRSHIKVRIVSDEAAPAAPATNPDQRSISVKANLVMVIPMIVRIGETHFTSSLSEPRIVRNRETGEAKLDVYLGREGNRSSMGNLVVTQRQGGRDVEVGALRGIAVYRPTARRLAHVPLHDLQGESGLTIRYTQPADDGGAVLAETTLR